MEEIELVKMEKNHVIAWIDPQQGRKLYVERGSDEGKIQLGVEIRKAEQFSTHAGAEMFIEQNLSTHFQPLFVIESIYIKKGSKPVFQTLKGL
jgi:hypothetical protein